MGSGFRARVGSLRLEWMIRERRARLDHGSAEWTLRTHTQLVPGGEDEFLFSLKFDRIKAGPDRPPRRQASKRVWGCFACMLRGGRRRCR
ncbi:MAG: hypothetical protein CL908_19445 [Deltaproteobacteria bacterium]|nr:hypothetical protein [Deltaproteobacteria bacterium]